MRLSKFEIENIKKIACHHFRNRVHVYLFGSRTNNKERGGDIDLFICKPNREKLKIRSKINFITDLIFKIGEQKIDVVLDNPTARNSLFLKTIYKTRIQLC